MRTTATSSKWASNDRTAYSLIELLVTIGLIAILSSIALPLLRGARVAAQDTVSLSRVAASARLMYSHAHDRSDRIPLGKITNELVDPRQPTTSMTLPNGVRVAFPWFAHDRAWNLVLRSLGVDTTEVWMSPTAPSDGVSPHFVESDYVLTHAAMTRSAYWVSDQSQNESNLAAPLFSDALFPSTKALLWERWPCVMQRRTASDPLSLPTPAAFFDLHASTVTPRLATAPDRNLMMDGIASPLLTTRRGIEGNDY